MATTPTLAGLPPEEVVPEQEQETMDQEFDYGPKNVNLPQDMQDAGAALITLFMQQDRYVRRQEILDVRKARFFDRGAQYIFWNSQANMYITGQAGGVINIGSNSVDMPRYMDVYDIYSAYEQVITSVLSQNPPGVNFEPDDFMDEVDQTAADTAERYRHHIDRVNDRKRIQTDVARLFSTDGRVAMLTELVEDKERFGTDEEGNPKVEPIQSIHGVLETKCTILVNEISLMPYFFFSDDPDIVMAKGWYPEKADKIKDTGESLGESAYERLARLGVLQGINDRIQISDSFNHLTSRHRCFIRPAGYHKIPDEAMRKRFEELFPDGWFATYCGTVYCESENLSMDDCVSIGHARKGDGQNRPALLTPLIPLQETFNDLMNLWHEIYDYCVPMIWMDKTIDIQALQEQRSEPGNHQSAPGKPGQPLSDLFWPEPESQVPPELIEALNYLSGQLAQFITGALPALFGGPMEDNKTAKGYQQAKDQAMGRIGLPWSSIQEMYAKAYKQAILLVARQEGAENQSLTVNIGQGSKAQKYVLHVKDLTKGKFHCFPDQDTNFPETSTGMRQLVMLLQQMAVGSPEIQQILGVPDNVERQLMILGLSDWVVPQAEASKKQLREIEQLLKEPPIPPSPEELAQASQQFGMAVGMAHGTGQPPPPPPDPKKLLESLSKPSVPIDEQYDFHQWEYAEVQNWLSSEKRVDEEEKGNAMGIENVRLHGLAHFAQMQKLAAMMPPPEPQKPQGSPPRPLPGGTGA
jgi:hypothetical protein